MSRYFFHVQSGASNRDREGTELPSIRSARLEATRLGGRMLIDAPQQFCDQGDLEVVVEDERGLVLFTVSMIATHAPAAPRKV